MRRAWISEYATTWQRGRYLPTPTIIEAAIALYHGHSVAEISRSDAGAKNLHETTDAISQIITGARARGEKALCLTTGVPGAGKTLTGLNITTLHLNAESQLYSVFLSGNGPLVITRDLAGARGWLMAQARGSERYGIIASSHAERLKPLAIDVRTTVDPVHWFLAGKDDVRSSYYCEDVATKFQIQGLELDWACVTWDADFFPSGDHWVHREFRGNRWTNLEKEDRKRYLKNAYRVLLTRARQGMVIAVPRGDAEDPTRKTEWYDAVWDYLKQVGFPELPGSAPG